jgi:4-hydroxybenzoyl-CoA thioesterase
LPLQANGRGGDDLRMRIRQVIVTTSLDSHTSIDIPSDLRAAVERFMP